MAAPLLSKSFPHFSSCHYFSLSYSLSFSVFLSIPLSHCVSQCVFLSLHISLYPTERYNLFFLKYLLNSNRKCFATKTILIFRKILVGPSPFWPICFCCIPSEYDPRFSCLAVEAERLLSFSAVSPPVRIFGFVARKSMSGTENVCHLFAEHDPEQPASAIVNFVSKVMIGSLKK